MKSFSLLFSLILACTIVSPAQETALPDSLTLEKIRAASWPNDSIVFPDRQTVEFYRDVSDLWFATRGYTIPGLFITLLQYHGFTALLGPFSEAVFNASEECEQVRLYLFFRKSFESGPISAVKLGISRKTYKSPELPALQATTSKDPQRFFSLCKERLDGLWLDDASCKE